MKQSLGSTWCFTLWMCQYNLKKKMLLMLAFLAASHLWVMPAGLTFTTLPAHTAGGGEEKMCLAASSRRSITYDRSLFFLLVKRTEVLERSGALAAGPERQWPWINYKGACQGQHGGTLTLDNLSGKFNCAHLLWYIYLHSTVTDFEILVDFMTKIHKLFHLFFQILSKQVSLMKKRSLTPTMRIIKLSQQVQKHKR